MIHTFSVRNLILIRFLILAKYSIIIYRPRNHSFHLVTICEYDILHLVKKWNIIVILREKRNSFEDHGFFGRIQTEGLYNLQMVTRCHFLTCCKLKARHPEFVREDIIRLVLILQYSSCITIN